MGKSSINGPFSMAMLVITRWYNFQRHRSLSVEVIVARSHHGLGTSNGHQTGEEPSWRRLDPGDLALWCHQSHGWLENPRTKWICVFHIGKSLIFMVYMFQQRMFDRRVISSVNIAIEHGHRNSG